MLEAIRQVLNRRLEALLGKLSQPAHVPPQKTDIDALRMRGNEFIATGDMVQAEGWFRKALEVGPDDMHSLVCLGYVLKEQERLAEARVALRKAINASHADSDVHETYYLLGQISEQQGDLDDAVRQYTAALQLRPEFSRACKDLCRIYQQRGNSGAVRETLEKCVQRCPDNVDYRLWLTDVCVSEIDYKSVVEHQQAAIRLGATTTRSYLTLGSALCRIGEVEEGMQAFALAEAKDPQQAFIAQYEIGYYYLTAGDLERGLSHMERCIELEPAFVQPHSSVIMTLSYARPRATGDYQRAALRYAEAVRRAAGQLSPTEPEDAVNAAANNVLRIGFVSADLHKHPVAFFLLDVLRHFERQDVRLVAYCNNPVSDEVTESLKGQFDEWYPIRNLSDADAAALIRSHKIDVLVDLAGHTGETRLAIFARRPAPTQVTWLGYWASTGLSEIDYILADRFSVPDDSTEWFAEKIYRLPHTRLCMAIPQPSRPIPVTPPPCIQNGHVVFGAFQQVSKITPAVLAVWAKVLDAVPGSHLRLQTKSLGKAAIREKLSEDMRQAGIDLARVQLLGEVSLESYLEAHGEVDILLDTFPYPGGTTTSFALWMGVPTITMARDTMISRQGAAMLQSVGLADWVALDEADYIEIAKKKSRDTAGLAALRMKLRATAEASPLFDAKLFARDLESAFFSISGKARV